MRVAIVGAGYAGLAAAYHLSPYHEVTLLDRKGIGAGASGVSAGLLHPYPGKAGRKSIYADVAMQAARELLEVASYHLQGAVASYSGILRTLPLIGGGEDVERVGEHLFLIKSGITVFSQLYLEGLWIGCTRRGVQFHVRHIDSLQELDSFDQIILATGAGISQFPETASLRVRYIKGQVVTCLLPFPMEQTICESHYIALTPDPSMCSIGATYERSFLNDLPDLETAVRILQPKWPIVTCRAGIRVANQAHYVPMVAQINPKTWVITALGSRGLLYHAFLPRFLSSLFLP